MDQVILRISGAGGDLSILDQAHALNDRAKRRGGSSCIVSLFPKSAIRDGHTPRDGGAYIRKCIAEFSRVLPLLTDRSLLYVVGHGDWVHQSMSGWDGGELAQVLVEYGGLRAVGKVSITGCFMGGHGIDHTAKLQSVGQSTRTFAGALHVGLGQRGVLTKVIARTEAVAILSESSLLDPNSDLLGKKVIGTATRNHQEVELKVQLPTRLAARGVKIKFEWIDGRSVGSNA